MPAKALRTRFAKSSHVKLYRVYRERVCSIIADEILVTDQNTKKDILVLFTRPVAIKKIFVGFANLGKTTGEVTLNKLCEILRRKKARARKLRCVVFGIRRKEKHYGCWMVNKLTIRSSLNFQIMVHDFFFSYKLSFSQDISPYILALKFGSFYRFHLNGQGNRAS